MRCATHPSVETELSCGKCGKPICPQCLVHTPVGARCADCAAIRRLPTYDVPGILLLRGVGAGLGAALVAGAIWALLLGVPFIGFLLALAVGYAVGETISLAT